MDYLFVLFLVLFAISFLGGGSFIAYVVISQIVRTWEEKRRNDLLPIESLPARVVAKRLNASGHDRVSTWYYVTFEFPSGDRRELCVDGQQYGLIAEGDQGLLTSQGTRFHHFSRERAGKVR